MVTAAIKEQILSDLDHLSPEQQRQAADLVRALATPIGAAAWIWLLPLVLVSHLVVLGHR